jgi:4-hydroxy-tetrahydrodipicolinate reductase
MGSLSCDAIEKEPDLELVARIEKSDPFEERLEASRPQVLLDFSVPDAVDGHVETAIELGIRPVIGTSGLARDRVSVFQERCREIDLGGIVAPNFSLGALLLMRLAVEAGRHLTQVEILELHHDRKIDAPSATAIRTAELMAQSRSLDPCSGSTAPVPACEEKVPGVRGGEVQGIRIHSVRLPGLLAHQEVLLGGPGQLLTLRHDTFDRTAFLPGILLALRKVSELDRLVVGLENVLWP